MQEMVTDGKVGARRDAGRSRAGVLAGEVLAGAGIVDNLTKKLCM